MNTKKLVQQLEKVPLSRMYQASQRGLVRLHLFATGRIHEMMIEFGKQASALLLKRGDSEGKLDGVRGLLIQRELIELWGDSFKAYSDELMQWREQAALMPFGVMAMFHERLVKEAVSGQRSAISDASTTSESASLSAQRELTEAAKDGVFTPQLRLLLKAAEQYLYGDGLTLSDRIWRVDNGARDLINNVIMNGIANGDSAWDVAKQLEQFLGANEDCPRWTSTRLYGQTKKEIAGGSVTGLLRGEQCDGSGVAYNALRLARTEIQKIHALATDKMLVMQPWVEQEQVHLSAAHPESDICDEIVQGGEGGKGIYETGSIELPLHPNCLCFKTAVLMAEKDFTSKLNGWLKDGNSWPEMDTYAEELGVDLSTSLVNDASVISLAVWMFGDDLEKFIS